MESAFGSPFLASLPPAGSSFFAEEVEAAVDGATVVAALDAAGLLPYLPFFLAFAARAAFLFSALIFFLRLYSFQANLILIYALVCSLILSSLK